MKESNFAMNRVIATTILSIAIIITAVVLVNGYQDRNRGMDSISVTGLGKQDFTSDLIVWNGRFTRKSMELKSAYQQLDTDRATIKAYLLGKGIKENEMVFSAVDINKEERYVQEGEYKGHYEFDGYRLTQNVQIESNAVDEVERITREVTELINKGVEFYSNPPQYYYTKLAELKVTMIAAATEDATIRAKQIAEKADSDLGPLRSASMGVFQIIAQNSNEDYSWGGAYNTTNKHKTATITMRLKFGVD